MNHVKFDAYQGGPTRHELSCAPEPAETTHECPPRQHSRRPSHGRSRTLAASGRLPAAGQAWRSVMARNILKGMRIAILVTDGFEQVELVKPRSTLDESGALTQIVSPKHGHVRSWNFTDWGVPFPVNVW